MKKPLRSVRALRREVNSLKAELKVVTDDRDLYQLHIIHEFLIQKQNMEASLAARNAVTRIAVLLSKVLPFPGWRSL